MKVLYIIEFYPITAVQSLFIRVDIMLYFCGKYSIVHFNKYLKYIPVKVRRLNIYNLTYFFY